MYSQLRFSSDFFAFRSFRYRSFNFLRQFSAFYSDVIKFGCQRMGNYYNVNEGDNNVNGTPILTMLPFTACRSMTKVIEGFNFNSALLSIKRNYTRIENQLRSSVFRSQLLFVNFCSSRIARRPFKSRAMNVVIGEIRGPEIFIRASFFNVKVPSFPCHNNSLICAVRP